MPTRLVLRLMLEDPSQELYGLEIGQAVGLASGTVHPILARLEGLGWLESRWEDVEPRAVGRPQRRYYRLTGMGAARARAALASSPHTQIAFGRLRPAGGSA